MPTAAVLEQTVVNDPTTPVAVAAASRSGHSAFAESSTLTFLTSGAALVAADQHVAFVVLPGVAAGAY